MAWYVFHTEDVVPETQEIQNPDQGSHKLTRWVPSVDDMYQSLVVNM